MRFQIFLEWREDYGLSLSDMYPFREGIEYYFKNKEYGNSIETIRVILNCLGQDVKQRKRYKKASNLFDYDILLDYFLIKNLSLEEKKKLIRNQFHTISEQTFEKYKFADFNKAAFLEDLKSVVETIKW